MSYRTKTYIAGDWTGDSDAITQLMKWNEGDKWALHFLDVHSYTSSYDSSLPCSIKSSLSTRMGISKTFILVVGAQTNTITKGACRYCGRYGTYSSSCLNGHPSVDQRSFVKYECDLARNAYNNGDIKIVVLYNSTIIDRNKCPESLRWVGTHAPMKKSTYSYYLGKYISDYDYSTVKDAIEK